MNAATIAGTDISRRSAVPTPVAAEVADLPMLSAHADANELIRWLSGFRRPPSRVFIVHGEAQASEALRSRIDQTYGWDTVVPRQSQSFEL